MSVLQPVNFEQPVETPGFDKAQVRAMQRAVIKLFERWSLTEEQACVLLGDVARRTYQRWKTGSLGRVGIDQAARLSNLLGIHKALRLMFSEPSRGYRWIKQPNAAFAGQSALEVMLNGQLTDLMRVRRYLDAARGQ